MDHFHAIGILGVAARVERSNKTYFESRGDAAEAKRLEAIIEDYETAIALLQAPAGAPISQVCAAESPSRLRGQA